MRNSRRRAPKVASNVDAQTGKRKIASVKEEAIRVVPPYQPEPTTEVVERRRLDEIAAAKLTYRGGPLLTGVVVYTIFWGKTWNSTAAGQQLMKQINDFYEVILTSALMDQMSEYSVAGQEIGHGSWGGTKIIAAGAPTRSVTDSTIRAQLLKWTRDGSVARPTKNTLYFLYLDPGIISIMGGSRSCQSFCGYHNNVGKLYYAVMPYPSCPGCLGGMSAFDALTGTSSHELCEGVTDPVPGSGWYDDHLGEIGDICAWHFKKVGDYTVQLEWSNQQRKCV